MPLHERYPPVIQLAIHLENGQRVYFTEQTARDRIAAEAPQTTLTAFLSLCQEYEFARTLLYTEVPKYYTWNKSVWTRGKRGRIVQDGVYETDMIGRLYTVSPSLGECFYLRLLLHEVRGPSSFNDLKTVDGGLFPTYRESCIARGLLDDDSALHNTLAEAATTATPVAIRCLFATIICYGLPSSPLDLWDHHHGTMIEDFFLQQPGITENAAKNMALLEKQVQLMSEKTLSVYGLPEPDGAEIHRGGIEYQRELDFNPEAEAAKCEASMQRLTNDQRVVFDAFMAAVTEGYGAIYFLDAPGSCGKTFLLQTVLAAIRAQRKIVLATASSGLAATLLHGGRTVHSTFKVPLNLQSTDSPMCSIKKGTTLARLIEDCSAIIIDEAPVAWGNFGHPG